MLPLQISKSQRIQKAEETEREAQDVLCQAMITAIEAREHVRSFAPG
jgi:hypothetical protein